ncbi:hypothetical protein CRYUN_Cryun14cG0061900 [Craigia yunnanensis]
MPILIMKDRFFYPKLPTFPFLFLAIIPPEPSNASQINFFLIRRRGRTCCRFLWRTNATFAISMHYRRFDVFDEAEEIDGLRSLMGECPDDKDMLDMATEDLGQALEEEKRQQNLLLKSLLPRDNAEERDCILEVRAGTGGGASLFAIDVFKMYERYSQKKGWKFDVVLFACSSGGWKLAISGAGVYGKLKFEWNSKSSVFFWQRVPVTEKSGRIHTSTVSVAILPQADEVDVQLSNEDLRIDTYRSGGSGGQHANTTNSTNKAKALKMLCAKMHEMERSRIQMSRSKLRSEQIGSGDRSERIQTYNFPQRCVSNHHVGITYHAINDVMQGENLYVFVDALLLQQDMDSIASFSSAQ